jgi:hypothetical protein
LTEQIIPRTNTILRQLCESVVRHTVLDSEDPWYGGVRCYLDQMIETRGAEACYAMAFVYRQTGENGYLDCARAMVGFLLKTQAASGWWINEGGSTWRGSTIFKTMALAESYFLLKDIDPPLCARIQCCISKAIDFSLRAFRADNVNINYVLTLCPVLWMAAEILGREELKKKASAYAESFSAHVNQDLLLGGEGDGPRSESAYDRVDVGYNLGMSLGAAAMYAVAAMDDELLKKILQSARAHLAFIYPDGSLDNSWGSRSYKWTLLDGKTVHGAAMTYLLLAHLDHAFVTALHRHLDYLESLMRDGELGMGPHFYRNPNYAHTCIHQTFSHACGLTTGLIHNRFSDAGVDEIEEGQLPCDEAPWARKFHSVNVVLHRSKNIMASLAGTAYSRSKDCFSPAIPSGGSISYLWGTGFGPIQVGSQYFYQRVEPGNMPESFDKPGNLTPRVDYHAKRGTLFSSAFERDTKITLEDEFHSRCEGRLKSLAGAECGVDYKIDYQFRDSGVTKTYELKGQAENWVFVREPIVFDPERFQLQLLENGLVVVGPRGQIRVTSSLPIQCGGWDRNSLLWCPFPSVYGLDLRLTYKGSRVWIDIALN